MSREDMFEGLEGTVTSTEREHYTPGLDAVDMAVVETVLDRIRDRTVSDEITQGYKTRLNDARYMMCNVLSRILPEKSAETVNRLKQDMERDSFDRAVNCVSELLEGSVTISNHPEYLDAILRGIREHQLVLAHPEIGYRDIMVQSLYNLGFNDFTLDLSSLRSFDATVGHYLHGTEDRPLKVRYHSFHTKFIGHSTRHCDIHSEGVVIGLGAGSESSSFHVHGYEGATLLHNDHEVPRQCTYYLHKGSEYIHFIPENKGKLERLYKRSNRVLKQDDNGTWKEVRP